VIAAIVAGIFAAAVLADYLPRRGAWPRGVRALYLTMLAAGFAVLMLHALGVEVPSPAPPIEAAVRAITGQA